MPADPRLLALPALRAEAERLARESHDAYWALMDDLPPKFTGGFGRDMTLARSNLLADLSRPESRDAVVRLCIAADTRWRVERRKYGTLHVIAPDGRSVTAGDYSRPADVDRLMVEHRRAYWLSLRDDPEALTLAALEVLRG